MFVLHSPGEVAFDILGFSVYWYGIVMALAVFTGVLGANYLAKKTEIPRNFFIDNSPLIILVGLLGARLYYCLLNFNYYLSNPVEIIDIRQGGLSIHGMILTGILAIWFLSRRYCVSFFKIADVLACAIPLSQAIGRWGNFFNSEAFGLPTNLNFGLYIDPIYRPVEYFEYNYFHPTFLYESIGTLLIFIYLFVFYYKNKRYNSGTIFFGYLVMYSQLRFIVEFLRVDSALNVNNVPIAQIVSILLFIIGAIGLFYVNRMGKNKSENA